MYEKVSVLVPTRNRIERLRTMLSSYDVTTAGAEHASELVFRIDDDDQETRTFLAGRGHPTIVGPRHRGYESLPIFFNELATLATGDVLMCGNDDMVFKTEHWAPRILEASNGYPDGIFNFGVKTHNETHYPFAIVSRKVVEQLGFIFDPRIFWGDIFLRDTMAAFGRCSMLSHVEIDHDWIGHAPDKVFLEGEGARRANWMQRHGEAVDDAVAKLRELVVT